VGENPNVSGTFEKMQKPINVLVVLSIGVAAMSTSSLLIRWLLAESVPPLVIAIYRLAIGTLAAGFSVMWSRKWRETPRLDKALCIWIFVSGVLLGLHFATWISSLNYTSVMISAVLVSTTPIWAGLLSQVLLGESMSRKVWVGVLVAVVGGSLIGLSSSQPSLSYGFVGGGLAVLGAIFGAGYLVIGRKLRDSVGLATYLLAVYGTATVTLGVLGMFQGVSLGGYAGKSLLLLIAVGLVPQVIGHSSANYAVRHLPATLVGIVILGEPIGSTILAHLFLDESPSWLQVLGATLILMGIATATMLNTRNKH
jgi:drug/metabolite transporter (DMT)-like permease